MAYDKRNSGTMSLRDKGDNPARPDYRGQLDVEGHAYWISAWIRVARTGDGVGQEFLSLKVEPKEAKPNPNSGKPKEWNNDIPY